MFQRFDAEAIFRIPLSRRYVPDVLVCLHNKNGIYLVRSGYQTARMLLKEASCVGESSVPVLINQVWARIWKLHVPNKIKVFRWRACQNILPTCENLIQRRIIEDDICNIYQRFPETAIHALWECGAAQDVWAGCPVQSLQKCLTGQKDVLQLFAALMLKLSEDDFKLFLVQCWLIWNQRNSVLHGSNLQEPTRLNARAKNYIDEYKGAQTQLEVSVSN